jgi:FtsP/CotA-like multicopper oxidase with cupredoxin domain
MPDFSIKIVPADGGLAGFQPDLPDSKVGDPLSVPPNSRVSWDNQTNVTHRLAMADCSYISSDILPQGTSKTDYITPDSGSISYRCIDHEGETGSIVVQPVVPMPPITPVVVLFFALALSALSAPPARAQTTPTATPSAVPTSQIPCLPPNQPLVKIPEIICKDGRLRATLIAGTELVRMPSRNPTTFDGKPSQPGDPQTFQGCFPEWVRTFRSPDTTTPFPPPTNGLADPFPGPTLRARVGDFIELTLINEIDPAKFGQSIDAIECESSSAGYPGGAGDSYPNCFHGSTTANIHFHGTHTNPTSAGDNVFLEILSSKRLTGPDPMPTPPSFDKFFETCEAELSKGSHVEYPVLWENLPQEYRDQQKSLIDRFDKQPDIGHPLWPINQKQIDHQRWPQYYIGSFPYCFKLPKYPDVTAAPGSTKGAGSNEMQAHEGMDAPAVVQQGGPLVMGQSPGTHWYHAHKHGSTTIDVSNGFVGAFIIEGQYDDEISEVYKAFAPPETLWTRTQPVLVINQFGTSPNLKGGAGQDKGPDFSVNGRTNPVISMKPGEVQMWRIVNASGRAGALFLTPPPGLNWRILARDGVQLHPDRYAGSKNSEFLLAAGNRVDLLVQAGPCTTTNGCTYPVNVHNTVGPDDLEPATPPARGPFKISLLTVNVAGNPVTMPFSDASPAKTFPTDLSDITDDEIRGTQLIDFGTVPQSFANGAPPKSPAAIHTINGKKFSGEVGMSVLLNKVEEWKVTNNTSNISHPFHIHINPFQVTEVFSPNEPLLNPKTGKPYVDKQGKPILDPHTNQPAVKYVFWKDKNVLPGQCYLDPSNPDSWVPMTWMAGPAGSVGSCVPTPHRQSHNIWWDVFPIPAAYNPQLLNANGSQTPLTYKDKDNNVKPIQITGYFKLRSRFVDYPGWFVIHCHILAHEDRGMMTVVEVTPRLSPYSHH